MHRAPASPLMSCDRTVPTSGRSSSRDRVCVGTGHDQVGHCHVGAARSRAGVRPVDHDRSARRQHDVGRMQIQVQHGVRRPEQPPHVGGRRDLVQPVMQLRQQPAVPAGQPRPLAEIGQHVPAVQPLHDQVGSVRVVDGRHRVAVRGQVPHGARLRLGVVAREAHPSQHPVRAERIDVRGPAHADQLSRRTHPSVSSAMSESKPSGAPAAARSTAPAARAPARAIRRLRRAPSRAAASPRHPP